MLAAAFASLFAQDYAPARAVDDWRFRRMGDGCLATTEAGGTRIGFGYSAVTGETAIVLQSDEIGDLARNSAIPVQVRMGGGGATLGTYEAEYRVAPFGLRNALIGQHDPSLLDRLAGSSNLLFRQRDRFHPAKSLRNSAEAVAALRACAAEAAGGPSSPAQDAKPAAAAPASREVQPPEPVNQAGWLSAADYPRASAEAGEAGTVGYALAVDAEGRVTQCAIARPTGFWRLDTTTCRLLRERARFRPARDASGRAVPARFDGEFSWRLAR